MAATEGRSAVSCRVSTTGQPSTHETVVANVSRPIGANAWVKEERKFKTLQERLDGLISGCDAAIALPGGPGTLTEIGLMWNLMIIDAIRRRPLILVGRGMLGDPEWTNRVRADQPLAPFDKAALGKLT